MRSTANERHTDLPRIAAHFAILDVFLIRPTARVDENRDLLGAVGADDVRVVLPSSIAKRELVVEVEVIIAHAATYRQPMAVGYLSVRTASFDGSSTTGALWHVHPTKSADRQEREHNDHHRRDDQCGGEREVIATLESPLIETVHDGDRVVTNAE